MAGPVVKAGAQALRWQQAGVFLTREQANKTDLWAVFGAASLPQKANSTNGLTGGYLALLYIITRAHIY